MVERIKQIINYTRLSERAFAESIGVKQNTLNQQIKGERSISLDTVCKILISYEYISAEWLLRGEGEMLQKNFSQTNADASLQQIYDSVLKGKDNEIKKLEAEINMLKGENRLLRELAGIEEGKNKSETKTA